MSSYVVPDSQFYDKHLDDGLMARVEISRLDSGDWRLSPHDPEADAQLAARFTAWQPEVHGKEAHSEEHYDYEPEL